MVGETENESELLDDLGELARQLRTYLEWQHVDGATGVPRDTRAASEFRSLAALPNRENSPPQRPAQPASPKPLPASAGAVNEALPNPFGSKPETRVLAARHPAQNPAKISSVSDITPSPNSLPMIASNLEALNEMVKACTSCELHQGRIQTVFSRGTGSSGLCFVGEGPGAEEDEQGLPFVGAAGVLLDKMISAMGLDRNEVYICNIVKCRPPDNRKPSDTEMLACSRYLNGQIQLLNPKVIVALGGTASAGLLGDPRGITKIRGQFRLYQGRIAVMPTFHPAYLLRNPAAKKEVWSDLRQVLQHLGRSLTDKQ